MSEPLYSINSLGTNHPSLDNPVYKVKQLVNGLINTIYVFNGKTSEENEEQLFKKIFNPRELEEIKREKTVVKFSEQQIHFDDSVGTIKIKILNELKKDISLDEIYLFSQKMETLNAVSVYQSLTQNNKIELTSIRLEQFISNIVADEEGRPFRNPPHKQIYTFDDIFEMNFDNKKYIINKVLGQKFFLVENEYPFVCNPYNVKGYDKLFEKSARKSLTTLNSHLLLNSCDIIDFSIYLCLAEDVITFINKDDISEETTIKVYYPFLYNKNINSLEDLEKNRSKLVNDEKKILNEKTMDLFNTIDMFYNVYNLRKSDLNYVNKGIKYIKAVLKPDYDITIPLEVIFKIIHATQVNPLIKFNPSNRQENVYRLFADKIATDGRKIPYLKKAAIFKLKKSIARNKSVAVYIESNEVSQFSACEFDENGFITISSEFKTFVTIDDVDNIFKNKINPIILEVKKFLEQSGYKINTFNSLNDENVEIKQLTYETQIAIKKPFDIQAYKGCISSIFINETNIFKISDTINLRFKRVANYSKFTSQEAFILEKSEQGLRGDQIIDALLENFPEELNREQAMDMVRKVANDLEIERGVRKTDIKIRDSPGFKTIINVEKETGVITITTENINNINYLYTLPIYLDTMVRLTQDKNSSNYPVKEINNLCLTGEKDDLSFGDIISVTEESNSNSEVSSIEPGDEEVKYSKHSIDDVDKTKDALSLFFDDDYGNEEEDEIEQGGANSDSGSSIESEPDTPVVKSKVAKVVPPSSDSGSSIASEPDDSVSKSSSVSIPAQLSSDTEVSIPASLSEQASSKEETPVSEKEVTPLSSSTETVSSKVQSEEEEQEQEQKPHEEQKPEEEPEQKPEHEQKPDEEPEQKPDEEPEQKPHEEPEQKPDEEQEQEPAEEPEHQQEQEQEQKPKQKPENEVKSLDNKKLNKPYYFQNLIEEKDPVLIVKEETPQFNSYVRTCSSTLRKQPVILTDEELAKINSENPGFLRNEDVIKYGSDEKHQFNYICPRYWCLKTNTIIDPKDLKEVIGKDGKKELEHPTCGKVLPRSEKKIKHGYYIYEFYSPKPGKKDYKKYPGLIPDSHPKGYCLPCCFDKYNTEGRIKANEKCFSELESKKSKNLIIEEGKEEKPKEEKYVETKEDEYVKGPEKFPLEPGRWGYLPTEIQTMLHEVNADCQISKTNTNIKENHPCLLRHGIQISDKQSFIACISDAIFFGKRLIEDNKLTNKVTKVLSIKEMRERIIKSLTIDKFIKYQNGNLVIDFYNADEPVDINKYTDSKLYSKLDMSKQEDKAYYTKVVSAYENFIKFLRDDNVKIDHTYLWDIISMPNKYLFPNGVNLVIFQIPHDDITNNVSLLCPTNHYSSEFYQARKPTIIIMKKDDYYEPIYSYTTSNKKISVIKDFKEYDPQLSKTMRAVFKEIIKPFFDIICKPLESMPNVYKAKRPLLLYDLIQKLDLYEYKTIKLVLNFNNKVIGVFAKEPGISNKTCLVPCYPSSLDEDIKKDLEIVFMTDLTIWNTYRNTVEFLNKLDKRSKKRRPEADIHCKPAFKIVEDEHVVGILTNTNQFIQISQPIRLDEISADIELPSINNENYIINPKANHMISSDVKIATEQDVDIERVDYIKKIRLENKFYNVFRNTIRILLNDYENITIRENIEKEMTKEYIIYSEKLKNIDKLLRELVKNKMQFIGDENYYKLINEVSTCIVKDAKSCKANPDLCALTDGNCNLILPEKNLITNNDNEYIYYGRMADELIRYNRIKSFMFQPKTYLSFSNIGYNLRDDEIILLESLLTQDYFETLVPAVTNKYVKQISYDEVEPIITQVYENTIPSLDHAIGRKNELACKKTTNEHIKSSIWKKCFPSNYTEIEYNKTNICTFNFIIDLIERKTTNKLTLNQIKNALYEEYKKYLQEYSDKIVDILILEGKKTLGDQVHAEKLSFLSLLYTDNYFLTTFDLWLLITKYEIPTIFISHKWILQSKYEKHEFLGYGNSDDNFAFIVIPGFRPENIPMYKLVQDEDENVFISLDKLEEECVERIKESIINKISIEDYLKNFTKPLTTNYEVKKPKRLIVNNDSDTENVKPKRKQKLIVNTSPVSSEQFVAQKKSRKKLVIKGNKGTTRKNVKQPKLIVNGDTS